MFGHYLKQEVIEFTMAEVLDSKIKQLSCPICLEACSSPKSLPCMHIFCEKCVSKLASDLREEEAHVATVSCPVCRSPIPAPSTNEIPNDRVAKLPNNSVILSLSASNGTDNDVPAYCEPCVTLGKRQISLAFCVTCSEYLCQTCYNCHKTFKTSRDHMITVHSVTEHQISNSMQEAMYTCQAHNETFSYFCSEHGDLCCVKCALKDHRKCKKLLSAENQINDVSDGQEFKQLLQNLDVLRKMFVVLIENRMKSIESIQQQKSDVIKSIKDWFICIKEQVNNLETAKINELEQICKEEIIIISDQAVECKSANAAIEMSQMLVESAKSGDRNRKFVTLTKVSQQVLKYLQKYDRVENRSKEIKIGLHGNENLEKIMQTLSSLNQLSCETSRIPKLSLGFSFDGAFTISPRVQLNSTVTFDAKVFGDKKVCTITSGVYLPDKRIVLSDKNNMKIKLFDKYFRVLSQLKLDLASVPRFICFMDERTVATSTRAIWGSVGRIVVMSVTDSLKQVRSIDVESGCFGITSRQQNLTVCVNGDTILTYDKSYEVSNRIQSFDSGVKTAISINPDGQRIHYTVQNKIVTMDMNGGKLEIFESDELKDVAAITVDKNGIIYCCGKKSNNVVLFTPEGRQLGVLLSHEHGLNNPTGICLNDKNNRLLVFQSKSSSIRVFTLV